MNGEALLPIIIAVVLVVLAWKFLGGLIKTVALVAILAVAAFFVFGIMR